MKFSFILLSVSLFYSVAFAETPALNSEAGRLRPGPIDKSARIYAQYAEQTAQYRKSLCGYIQNRKKEYSRRSTALVRDAINQSGFTKVPVSPTALEAPKRWQEQYVDLMTTEPFSETLGNGVEALKKAPLGSLVVLDGPQCTSKPGQWGDIKAKCTENEFSSVGDKGYNQLRYCKVKAILVDKKALEAIYPGFEGEAPSNELSGEGLESETVETNN